MSPLLREEEGECSQGFAKALDSSWKQMQPWEAAWMPARVAVAAQRRAQWVLAVPADCCKEPGAGTCTKGGLTGLIITEGDNFCDCHMYCRRVSDVTHLNSPFAGSTALTADLLVL